MATFELGTLTEYSDEALLAELQRVAGSLPPGVRLTIERFDSSSKVHSTTLRKRFGSWPAALDKANIPESVAPRPRKLTRAIVVAELRAFLAEHPGVSATAQTIAERLGTDRGSIVRRLGRWEALLAEVGLQPVPLGRRYTDEECFENILALWTHYGRQPVFNELKHPPSAVGPKAYIRRWGGWRAALAAFVERANETSEQQQVKATEATSSDAPQEVRSVPPRSISLSLRYRVLARDSFRCVACGASPAKDGSVELHVDHIHPWSKGGANTEENLRTLCFKCNLGKGARA